MKSIVIGTAGHIDHGKSALVRALTGTDPDRLKEEQARGITIDLGFAHCAIGGVNFAFVDVPGHERFVRNMLAGAGGIDAIVLVVAADESVMPQTREHFQICRLLGVSSGIVAITKADLVDADMLALVREDVTALVAGSFLRDAPIVPVSSKTGAGLDALRGALEALGRRLPGRSPEGPARLPIDRVFSKKGFGTIVTGTLVSGRLAVDQELVLAPGGRHVKIRGLQVHGAKQGEALAGNRTAVNLAGAEVADVHRGQSLVTPGELRETRVVDAVVQVLDDTSGLKHGARVHFHQGTAELLGRVIVAGPPRPGGGQPGADIPAGGRGYIRLRLEAPAVLVRGDRYILRAYSPTITIAGGQVLDPQPPRSRIRTEAALDRLRAMDVDPTEDAAARGRDDERAVLRMIADAGVFGVAAGDLTSRAGLAAAARTAMMEALVASGRVVTAGDRLLDPAVVQRLERHALDLLRAFHAANPLSDGMPREELRHRLIARADPAIFDRLLEGLIRAGRVAGAERIALASHRLALSPEEQAACALLERTYRDAGLKPPDAASVGAGAGVSAATLERMIALLTRQKQLVRIDTMLFHREALEALKQDLRAWKAADAGARLDVAAFKARFDVSRKFAIPLLEYLDRERVTRRTGDARVIL